MTAYSLIWSLMFALFLVSCAESNEVAITTANESLPYADRIDLVIECLRERGFVASTPDGFGVFVEAINEAAVELANEAEGECWEEVEERFPPPPPLSVEENYHYMVAVAECLRALGYEVPQAPTLETYVEQATAQSEMWNPYAYLSERGVDTWALQRDSCPPAPWAR